MVVVGVVFVVLVVVGVVFVVLVFVLSFLSFLFSHPLFSPSPLSLPSPRFPLLLHHLLPLCSTPPPSLFAPSSSLPQARLPPPYVLPCFSPSPRLSLSVSSSFPSSCPLLPLSCITTSLGYGTPLSYLSADLYGTHIQAAIQCVRTTHAHPSGCFYSSLFLAGIARVAPLLGFDSFYFSPLKSRL